MFNVLKKMIHSEDKYLYPVCCNNINLDNVIWNNWSNYDEYGNKIHVFKYNDLWYFFPKDKIYIAKNSILYIRSFICFNDKYYYDENDPDEIAIRFGKKYLDFYLVDGKKVTVNVNYFFTAKQIKLYFDPLCNESIIKNDRIKTECMIIMLEYYNKEKDKLSNILYKKTLALKIANVLNSLFKHR